MRETHTHKNTGINKSIATETDERQREKERKRERTLVSSKPIYTSLTLLSLTVRQNGDFSNFMCTTYAGEGRR